MLQNFLLFLVTTIQSVSVFNELLHHNTQHVIK